MAIRIKRVYEKPARSDGHRVLVDRVWPRGVSKEDAAIDEWLKEIAPTTRLRKWFGHEPDRWGPFQEKYFKELDEKKDALKSLAAKARKGRVTLVFGAKDEEHNNAVALKKYLKKRFKV